MTKRLSLAALMAFVVSLALPALAAAQDEVAADVVKSELDVTWIIVSAVLVLFMQAGFLFLEIGLFEILFFEKGGDESLDLWIEGPDLERQPIAPDQLFHGGD